MSETQKIIDINSLSIEELTNLQRQIEMDISFFQESINELKTVASKFGRCQVTVDSMNPEEKNKEALVPLSESVYISAKIPDPDEYLIEIGTGYYVQMNREQGRDYFRRKYAFVESQLETVLRKVMPEKQQARQAIVTSLQKKIQQVSLENNPK